MTQRDEIIVVGELARELGDLPGRHICTSEELSRVYTEVVSESRVWLASEMELFRGFGRGLGVPGSQHRLLVINRHVPRARREYLRMFFRSVDVLGAADRYTAHVSAEELADILSTDHPDEYILQAVVDLDDEVVLLLRGNLERLAVPFEWFFRFDPKHAPDFENVRIEDYGQTLELGEHDVAIDALLYEFDSGVRRRLKDRRLLQDDSLGASLRRLRLHKGLTQADFDPITVRQIRRIERGEAQALPRRTLRTIAERLDVDPQDIDTY